MDIFYIENFKVPDRLEVLENAENTSPTFQLRTVCFTKTTLADFVATLGLDEIYTTEIKLVHDVAPIYYDTVSKAFYKYYTSFKKDEFAKTAMTITLEHGHIFKKIDWKPNFLSPKMLIHTLMKKFVKDMINHDFQELYN